MVFTHSRNGEYDSLPEGAKAARRNAGNIIPMVLVTTANGKEEIQGISYDILKEDMRDANRDLKDLLETVNVLGSSESEPASEETTEADTTMASEMLAEEPLIWTNADGKEISAAVKALDGDKVIFVIQGNEVPYPMDQLSSESQKLLRELAP